jgi:predicted nucleic acid-binding protein
MTRQSLPRALKLEEAVDVIEQYTQSGARIVDHRPSQLKTFVELLRSTRSRKKVFDVALAATLKDNGIEGLYTANVADFASFKFLRVVNPLPDTQ